MAQRKAHQSQETSRHSWPSKLVGEAVGDFTTFDKRFVKGKQFDPEPKANTHLMPCWNNHPPRRLVDITQTPC